MARLMLVVGFTAGVIVTTIAGAAVGLHADEASAEILEAAAAAHVDPIKLEGALNTLQASGLPADPYGYLRMTGDLPDSLRPPSISQSHTSQSNPRTECIIHAESRGDPHAVNPRSGASGLGQFLPGTWKSTPQGRAGLSVFDPAANRQAVNWMVSVGRAREFAVVTAGLC